MRTADRLAPLLLAAAACSGSETAPPVDRTAPIPTPEIHTPRWAFEPWISKDISDGADTRQFLDGFRSRDIPVGVVVIDSPWETDYNTFVPNEARYPNMSQMIADFRAMGVRTVLWCTQMLNEDSFDAEEGGDVYDAPSREFLTAARNDWFVNDGETYFWWKGKGAGIDFFDGEARAFWHGLQDPLLDAGLAGWKLDFGESYIETPTVKTDAGVIDHQAYSEEYYRDFWAYGVQRNGVEELVTMVRPYDDSYHFDGRFFARPEHAPVAWVGDNRRDFVGLVDALDHLFRSAQAGYVVIGSDIGGYLDRDDEMLLDLIPYDADAFMRWTALGAMTPFMQLHGRANLEPWAVPERTEETLEGYRYWSVLHHELVPFFYSLAEEAYASEGTILHPIGAGPDAWADDWRFLVGDAFLVAPIIEASGVRDVELPGGARWYDWWAPDADPHEGGTTLTAYDAGPGARIPLFVKSGAIVPMTIERDLTGIGAAGLAGHLTVLVYPGDSPTRFVLHEEDGGKTEIAADGATVTITRAVRPTVFVVRAESMPARVAADGRDLAAVANLDALAAASEGWFYDAARRRAYAKVAASDAGAAVALF